MQGATASSSPALWLSEYDHGCGRAIDAAFAAFQGMDPSDAAALVFAVLVHRYTGGRDDGSGNPLRVEGAGWAGFAGFPDVATATFGSQCARFISTDDGCRAAAVVCNSPGYRSVQSAYRAGDPLALAAALGASRLGGLEDLSGFAEEVRLAVELTSLLPDRDRYLTVMTQNTP